MAMIIVGMADLKIAKEPDILTTLGLGSCVGIALYDARTKIGGLAHIMLPVNNQATQNRMKYADTAIIDLINQMGRLGAYRPALVAKLAGGAHMFGNPGNNNILRVGERNVKACIDVLSYLKIPIHANDTGGCYGRTIELCTSTGILKIKTAGHGEKIL